MKDIPNLNIYCKKEKEIERPPALSHSEREIILKNYFVHLKGVGVEMKIAFAAKCTTRSAGTD